jgi:hypothetical protein
MGMLLFKWLTLVFAAVLGSSFISMMAAFVGSRGTDLQDLMVLQAISIPVAIALVVWCFGIQVHHYGYRNAISKAWDCLPGWLLFGVLAANSLVLIAELSFLLIQHHTAVLRPWQEHVPAATAFSSSLAVLACYVTFRLAKTRVTASAGGR